MAGEYLGAIGGAAVDELTAILTRQFREQLLQQQQAEEERAARERESLMREELSQRSADRSADADYRQRSLDEMAASRRDRANWAGLEEMYRQAELNQPPAPEPLVPKTINVGGRPVIKGLTRKDLEAGVEEYREPAKPPSEPREPKQWVVDASGTQQYRVPQPGDRRHDPAGERQAAASAPAAAEALDTAAEVKRIAQKLRTSPGRNAAFGVLQSRLPTVRQDTSDAEVLLKSLTSLLTLENTGKLKGVLSNADMEILRRASSTIAPEMGDAAADEELGRLVEVMDRAIARMGGSTAPPPPMEEPRMDRTGAPTSGPTTPKVGDEKVFPNGRRARFDGKGWAMIP